MLCNFWKCRSSTIARATTAMRARHQLDWTEMPRSRQRVERASPAPEPVVSSRRRPSLPNRLVARQGLSRAAAYLPAVCGNLSRHRDAATIVIAMSFLPPALHNRSSTSIGGRKYIFRSVRTDSTPRREWPRGASAGYGPGVFVGSPVARIDALNDNRALNRRPRGGCSL